MLMEYTRTIERSIDAGAAQMVRIANRRGSLTVRGADREDIGFVATLRVKAGSEQEAEELFDEVELPISEREGTVEIGPPEFGDEEGWWGGGRRRPTLDMELAIPRACSVHATNRAGSIGVEGVRAAVEAKNRAGAVRVRDIEGAVTAETRAGEVQIRSVRGAVAAETRAGGIKIEEVTGDVTLQTRAGGIRLKDIDGAVQAGSRAGEVWYRGRIRHEVEISVRAGAIQLGVTPDSSFFLDAESGLGSVESELDVDGTQEPEADAPTVRLRTGVGSIRIGSA